MARSAVTTPLCGDGHSACQRGKLVPLGLEAASVNDCLLPDEQVLNPNLCANARKRVAKRLGRGCVLRRADRHLFVRETPRCAN